jgi:hypothetical protein
MSELTVTPECAFEQAHEAKAHELAVLELNATKYAVEMAITAREAVLKQAIADETNGEDKKKYSNADARQAEFLSRRAGDEQIAQLQSTLADTNREIGEHQVDAKHAARCVRIICAFASRDNGDDSAPWEE